MDKKFYVGYAIIAVLCFPMVYFSFNTDFALIDDYSQFGRVQALQNEQGALWNNILSVSSIKSPQRFRPVYEIAGYFSWSAFQNHPGLHHLSRLLLKLITGLFTYGALKTLLKDKSQYFPYVLTAFLTIYVFYPNNPEARLGPCEPYIALFFSIFLYGYVRCLVGNNLSLADMPFSHYLLLLMSFIGLLGCKETTLALGAPILAFLVINNCNKRGLLALSPFGTVLLYATLRVWGERTYGLGYQVAPLSTTLVFDNFIWYFSRLFLLETSSLIFLVWGSLLSIFLYRQLLEINSSRKTDIQTSLKNRNWAELLENIARLFYEKKEFAVFLFLSVCALCYFLITLAIAGQALRYFYPLVYIIAVLVALAILSLREWLGEADRYMANALFFVLCSYFVAVNYYNFLYQFASQYAMRNYENVLKVELEKLLDGGTKVYVLEVNEYEESLFYYFADFRPFYYGEKAKNLIQWSEFDCVSCEKGSYFVHRYEYALGSYEKRNTNINPIPPHQEIVSVINMQDEDDISILRYSRYVSYVLQSVSFPVKPSSVVVKWIRPRFYKPYFGGVSLPAFRWGDPGANGIGDEGWVIFKNLRSGIIPAVTQTSGVGKDG